MVEFSRDLLGLEQRIVMVTGAGRGFGRSVARSYARNGATVITVDPDVEMATAIASEVEQLGATAIPIRGDMSVVLDVMNTFEKIEELFGMLDGIVHVTSAESKTPFVELLEGEWYDLLNADVKSSLYVLQQGLRYLSGGGFVTLVLPPLQREQPHVAAIRGAVAGLIEGATRIFPTNVRVNGVIPSRDPVGEEHDRPLVRVAVALGSMVSEGVRGQLLEVLLPEPPHQPEIYDLLRELP
ncbi:MAG: SDR family NAD(P)-dependent oxidoreductase [Meiothermus sp.]|uniref:SDR family NAD(P)-dependent oxidoreductase n=1 Tax=unclassified Meiothermus TaxID=370471 RepID=UPI001AA0AFB0|nr:MULTISPECIES: SDR family NAD(P)-dependent oxidoreductase [unclassified Meiothermus]MBO1437390.1 SDR family NAD(P)-dependent oxidoreductase [Meiothermus sp. CFH 77666]MCS7067960.1 SDR family oxidoreductase [Meiothermus sp.]MDW8426286.1 SDR family NAD(P)-dependent oxidoreductase [Meiothermus sp.]